MHLIHDPAATPMPIVEFDEFLKLDIRIGTVIEAADFPEARKPALKLQIDFGDGVGVKKSSVQITEHYQPDELIGRQVMAVVNFAPRQIGPVRSEVLTLGFADRNGHIILGAADKPVPNGARLA